ncbi:hypothetical protein VOLCADRAFT_63318, partial [Volvox carteri f. nagariensis]
IGVGDITGPAADVNLMGYANPMQTAQGVHTRLSARAFVFAEPDNPRRRFVYVSMDACMASQLVTLRVVQRLKALYGEDLYDDNNVAISGTHTHASPAGFLQYLLYDITSLGFVKATFDAMVDGIVTAIQAAHESLRPAILTLARGELETASINRSPTAYLANPEDERGRYDTDVDTDMTLLRLTDAVSGAGRGALSWFAVHCTSLNNTNRLVSGDNKAAAQLAMEWWAAEAEARAASLTSAALTAGQSPLPSLPSAAAVSAAAAAAACSAALGLRPELTGEWLGVKMTGFLRFESDFVAAVAQSSVGDTSPNTGGAFCLDTGLPCDPATSTCNGRNELCHGRGPAWPDDRASAAVIGGKQFLGARRLYEEAGAGPKGAGGTGAQLLQGPLDFRSTFLDMANITVAASPWSTRPGRTCPPAMGMSFAAGTTDGECPGAFDFTQGDTRGPPLWRLIRGLVLPPSREQQTCHAPKPILLDTGQITVPYLWQPRVTQISLLRLGQLVIACVPGEFTTMAGRRLKRALRERFAAAVGSARSGFTGDGGPVVVLSGLTGTYSSYVTTWEEYQVQRYEGASTLYGPHTLDAYIQEFLRLADAMIEGRPLVSAVQPPDLEADQVSLLGPVVLDWVPPGAYFGQVTERPKASYQPGQTARATFRAANPRNNLRTGLTFMAVEMLASACSAGEWRVVYDDRDWVTRFNWHRPHSLSPESFASLEWDIAPGTPEATYRFRYFGDAKKALGGEITAFEGCSEPFRVERAG